MKSHRVKSHRGLSWFAARCRAVLKGVLAHFRYRRIGVHLCEPADEVLPAHHNGDTAGSLEKKLIGRHPPVRKDRLSRDVIIIIIVPPFASRDLVFATNQGGSGAYLRTQPPPNQTRHMT